MKITPNGSLLLKEEDFKKLQAKGVFVAEATFEGDVLLVPAESTNHCVLADASVFDTEDTDDYEGYRKEIEEIKKRRQNGDLSAF